MNKTVTVEQVDRDIYQGPYEDWIATIPGEFDRPHISEAFAAGYKAATLQYQEQIKMLREALGELVAACDGEVSEVFAGELDRELDLAVKALEATNG